MYDTGVPEHVVGVERSKPVAVGVGVVVAGSSAVTLDEGNLPEVFQTGSGRGQQLTRALRPHTCFLYTNNRNSEAQRSQYNLLSLRRAFQWN